MKLAIKTMLFLGLIGWFLSNFVPRVMSDLLHAGDFVPAQGYVVTRYECTNWNFFMFNDCTVTFVSLQTGESRQIMDFRFGRAPSERGQLLQRRDDPSSLTTDVSLRTVWNRLLVILSFIVFGLCIALALVARAFKDDDETPMAAPTAAPSEEPQRALAPAPTRRASFGRRHS